MLKKLFSWNLLKQIPKVLSFVGKASDTARKGAAFLKCFEVSFKAFKDQWHAEFPEDKKEVENG